MIFFTIPISVLLFVYNFFGRQVYSMQKVKHFLFLSNNFLSFPKDLK